MTTTEFSWERSIRDGPKATNAGALRLSDEILGYNARWFIQLRWVAIAVLFLYEALSHLLGDQLIAMGIVPAMMWPLAVGTILMVANIGFWLFLRTKKARNVLMPEQAIWIQIIIDLICLAFVVHFLGAIGTPAPFIYCVHVVLSCVFFSVTASLLVTVLASTSYLACIGLERLGNLSTMGLLVRNPLQATDGTSMVILAHTIATIALFFAIWYVVSRLSISIRVREDQLVQAEAQTRKAQAEKDRYAVQMTHQLKSPLDAIRTSISLLTTGRCGEIPAQVLDPLRRIEVRAHNMSELVKDVLKLSRLKSEPVTSGDLQPVNLAAELAACLEELRLLAERKSLAISLDAQEIWVSGVAEQIQMFFNNLLSNAIAYSFDKGAIAVSCRKNQATGEPVVSIADQGIGIASDKLAHVFDEYYRTPEAAKYNPFSSGIGLSIVKRIAQNHGIRLVIESDPGKGTTIRSIFPAETPAAFGAMMPTAAQRTEAL
jgi:signal transduction histidine kinase